MFRSQPHATTARCSIYYSQPGHDATCDGARQTRLSLPDSLVSRARAPLTSLGARARGARAAGAWAPASAAAAPPRHCFFCFFCAWPAEVPAAAGGGAAAAAAAAFSFHVFLESSESACRR